MRKLYEIKCIVKDSEKTLSPEFDLESFLANVIVDHWSQTNSNKQDSIQTHKMKVKKSD